jgi:hypothetical protein
MRFWEEKNFLDRLFMRNFLHYDCAGFMSHDGWRKKVLKIYLLIFYFNALKLFLTIAIMLFKKIKLLFL